MIYLVLPAAATVQALALIDEYASQNCPVIHCAKGLIDAPRQTGLLLPEYMADYAPTRPFAMLSGPSFADEVIRGLPCALVASSNDSTLCDRLISHFAGSHVRLYKGADPIGVAVGGAVKNVIALAAGIASGLGLGDNAAMIAWAGVEKALRDESSLLDFAPRPRWPLDEGAAPPPGRGVRG